MKLLLILAIGMLCHQHASAIKIKIKGAGGILIENDELVAVCPKKTKAICAILDCKGIEGILGCMFIKLGLEMAKEENELYLDFEPAFIRIYHEGKTSQEIPVMMKEITHEKR